jgi:aminoglycoside phosphotransferase (APT) family kinase protein
MQSLSKTHLTEETLHAIARRHLESPTGLRAFEEMTDGYFNAAYRLELADGRQCVLKVAPPKATRILRYERDILRVEVEVLRLVREQTSVPVPEVLAYDPSGEIVPSPFFVMSFVPGVPFNKVRKDWSAEEQAAIDSAVGGFVRQIGNVRGPAFGWYAQPENQRPTWRAAFALMLQNLLADGRDLNVELPLPYDELIAQLMSHFEVLDEVQTPQLVHWDLWDGNVFVDPNTRTVTGVIDFERGMWADPLMEVCFRRLNESSALMRGYGENLLATPNQKRRRILYNLHLYLIIIIEHFYRQYETDDLLRWGRECLREELGWLSTNFG